MSQSDDTRSRREVDISKLPDSYPTHRHAHDFWESLGRAVATFGFLEEILAKAVFALTATTPVPEGANPDDAIRLWIKDLERVVSDTLGVLIGKYETALTTHPEAQVVGVDILIADLRHASRIRNVICHGSWAAPNEHGASLPFFVDRDLRIFNTPLDAAGLDRIRVGTVELACKVVSTVAHMGYQFPSSEGPGQRIA